MFGKKLLIIAAINLFTISEAFAIDGNKFLRYCRVVTTVPSESSPNQMFDAAYCLGVVGGMNSLNIYYQEIYNNRALYCLPKGVSDSQATKVVVKWLESNPKHLHKNHFTLAIAALVDAYPCKEK